MTTNFFTHARLAHGYWRAHEWGLDDQGFLRMIHQALALGIRVFDHAACYGGFTTEEMFGRGLALEPSLREQMCIVSKCGILFPNKALPWMKAKHYDNSRKHIVWSAERSVRSLQCGYLDLLLIHRPSPCANPEEIAGAFDELRRRGLVRRFGVSNFAVPKFRMLQSYLAEPLLTNQIEASPLHLNAFDDGTIDLALRMRIRPMVWSPLAGGRLFDTTDACSVDDHAVGDLLQVLQFEGGLHQDGPLDGAEQVERPVQAGQQDGFQGAGLADGPPGLHHAGGGLGQPGTVAGCCRGGACEVFRGGLDQCLCRLAGARGAVVTAPPDPCGSAACGGGS